MVRIALVVAVCMAATALATESRAATAVELVEQGNWEEAYEESLLRDDADSLRVRARFALWFGDDDDARRFVDTAVEMGSGDSRRRAEAEAARMEWLFGERDQALERLREQLRRAPDNAELRYELGWRLIDDGDVEEGRTVVEGLARRYNDGLIDDIDELVWLGRAMKAADRPRDANRALSRALSEDESHLEANLRFGQLMWSHSNVAEAEEAFERVLERFPEHPEALVAMADIEFYQSGRFAESMELVDRAHQRYPGHPEVARKKADLMIAQGAWREGRQIAESLLERAPEDTDGLSLVAAASHLLADQRRFEEARDRFDERRSNRPTLLSKVGEFAAMNNRHRASIPLFEQALERDDEHGPALTGLGTALTRIGEESRGIDVLERAFDVDRYQVPVYNTLELYERGLRDYVTQEVKGFRLRAHKDQFELIRRVAEPLVAEATDEFEERYGVEIEELTLEVFADGEAFSVRSVGLPHVDPHGICFGPVVLTRGPGSADFNWSMVVWHELAHSYHLELSDERVPVWFTEGLAEYETRMRDGAWTRFHDLALARRLVHDRMWSITELDEIFMTGRGHDVGHAYQVAMLVMKFLDDTRGFDVIVEMLERFSQTPDAGPVFEETLGVSIDAIDREFQTWLEQQYSALTGQTLVDWMGIHAALERGNVDRDDRAKAEAYRAVMAAIGGDDDRARIHLDAARDEGNDDPKVAVVAVVVYDLIDDIEAGLKAGRQALETGAESYDLRLAMARMAQRADKPTKAFVHARAAATLAFDETEAWRQFGAAAEGVGDEVASAQALRQIYRRDPHSSDVPRDRLVFFVDRGDYHGGYEAARRWTEIAPLDARAHLAVGRMAVELDKLDTAEEAWRRAAIASPGRKDEIRTRAVEQLMEAGADDRAHRFESLWTDDE